MDSYYYASGTKVELEPDEEHVAVDQAAAKVAGLDASLAATMTSGVRVGAGVMVALRSALPADIIKRLREAGAIQPVYRRDKAVMVAMPEVRIEFDNPTERSRVMRFLKGLSKYTIDEDTPDRLVVSPVSGKGEDAIEIANRIQEEAKPASVSPRFIQFTPKPTANSR